MAKKRQISIDDIVSQARVLSEADHNISVSLFQTREVIKDIREKREEDPNASIEHDKVWLSNYHNKVRNHIRDKNNARAFLEKLVKLFNKPKKKVVKNGNKK